jgi:hypothetical protein
VLTPERLAHGFVDRIRNALSAAVVAGAFMLAAGPALAADPTVRITSPTEGAVVNGADVTVSLDVGETKLVPGAQAVRKSGNGSLYITIRYIASR